jgi:hypothetical protein
LGAPASAAHPQYNKDLREKNEMKPQIKIALGSYDRHGPLLEGAIDHPFFDFEFLEVDPR